MHFRILENFLSRFGGGGGGNTNDKFNRKRGQFAVYKKNGKSFIIELKIIFL